MTRFDRPWGNVCIESLPEPYQVLAALWMHLQWLTICDRVFDGATESDWRQFGRLLGRLEQAWLP